MFKAGDKVRIVAQRAVSRGEVGTIVGETFDGGYVVRSDGGVALGTWWKSGLEPITDSLKIGDRVRILPHLFDRCKGLTGKIESIGERRTACVTIDGALSVGYFKWDELERIEEAPAKSHNVDVRLRVRSMEVIADTVRVTLGGKDAEFSFFLPRDEAGGVHLGDEYAMVYRKAKPGGL